MGMVCVCMYVLVGGSEGVAGQVLEAKCWRNGVLMCDNAQYLRHSKAQPSPPLPSAYSLWGWG